MAEKSVSRNQAALARAVEVDHHVGARMRERRKKLKLSQDRAAKRIGVSYEQWRKYETGINRPSAGSLYTISIALGVNIAYFFEGIPGPAYEFKPTPEQRMLLELARNFISLPSRKHQEALCSLARALASAGNDE